MKTKTYKISEVAEILGVHPDTIRNWEDEGLINPDRIGTRGDRRYTVEHIQEIKDKNLISNLSKKNVNKRDYSNLSKEDLIKEIQILKDQKSFGIAWEDEKNREKIIEECKTKAPILKPREKFRIEDKKGNSKKPKHILIQGDNYHALKVLNYTHKNKIDVIYIDPPYNTGNKDFIYNDSFIDKEDTYRHSKWLSFMKHRLVLARELLKDSGVIFISIDDNEQARLKLLCDEIFGEENFISMLVIESGEVFGTKAAHVEKTFVKVKDYVLVYVKHKNLIKDKQPLYDESRELYDGHYNTIINNDLSKISVVNFLLTIDWIKELFDDHNFKINSENINQLMKIDERFKNYIFTELSKKLFADAPFNKDLDFNDKIPQIPFRFEDKILFKTSTGSIRMYIPFSDTLRQSDDYISRFTRTTIRGDLWKNFHFDMRNVQDEGNIDFKNGKKPVRLVKHFIKWYGGKNAIILDFFAGSGTTGHAVLELNKEDEGNRQVIICTNNEVGEEKEKEFKDLYNIDSEILKQWKKENKKEWIDFVDRNGIASTITFERMKRIIKGENTERLGGELEYFETELVDVENMNRVDDSKKLAFTLEAGWVIATKENAFNEIEKNDSYQIFEGVENIKGKSINKTVAIYFKENLDKLKELENKILKKENVKLYIFSHFTNEFVSEYADYKNVKVCDIPEPILKVYRGFNNS